MKPQIHSKLDAKIADEIYQAAEDLGAEPARIRAAPLEAVYGVLKQLGASPHLLAIVGTWGEAPRGGWTEDDDAATLGMLRDWNAETEKLALIGRRTAAAH